MAEHSTGITPITYETAGDGPAVVFIHAGIADRRMWDPQFAAVPEGYRFVRVDLRGYGQSPLGESSFSNHEDVEAVLDHLAVDRAVIVGCSMGGGTALDLALSAPNRVSGLVLIGTESPGFEPEEHEPPQWPDLVKAFNKGDVGRMAELEGEIWVVGHGRELDDVDRRILELVIEMDLPLLATEKGRDELTVPLEPPRSGRMDEISAPTLVVVGEHDLPDVRAAAAHLAQTLSHHEAIVIPGAAHLASLEQPGTFNRALAGFLEAVAV